MEGNLILSIIISIVLTTIVVLGFRFYLKKNYQTMPFNAGCSLTVISLFIFFCIPYRITEKKVYKTTTEVTLVSSNKTIRVDDNTFTGSDTIYIKKKNLYLNDTGRDLVTYSVKYTKDGNNTDEKPNYTLIKPNQYFYWYDSYERTEYRMFQEPPGFAITRHDGYSTLLYFLDYADNVEGYVD